MAVTGILGKKIGMTQVFDEKGDVHPITVLQAGPCVITQLKTLARDGYEAAQIGLVEFVKTKNVTKPQAGHFAKTEAPPVKVIKEVDLELDAEGVVATKAGDRVLVDIFTEAKFVDVIGTSKGRGFAGVVRRHHFGGGPKSHGHMFQVQGSIGASSFPSRVFPGQRMPGHMGAAADHGAQSAYPRHRPRREPVDGRGRGARITRGLCADFEGQESSARASRLCRIRHGGSVEGFEEGRRQEKVAFSC